MSSSLCGASNKSKVIFLFNIAITLSTFKRKSADNFGQKAAFQNKLKSWHKAPDFSGKKVQCSRELKTKLAGRISAEYIFIHARGKAKIGFLFIYLFIKISFLLVRYREKDPAVLFHRLLASGGCGCWGKMLVEEFGRRG